MPTTMRAELRQKEHKKVRLLFRVSRSRRCRRPNRYRYDSCLRPAATMKPKVPSAMKRGESRPCGTKWLNRHARCFPCSVYVFLYLHWRSCLGTRLAGRRRVSQSGLFLFVTSVLIILKPALKPPMNCTPSAEVRTRMRKSVSSRLF